MKNRLALVLSCLMLCACSSNNIKVDVLGNEIEFKKGLATTKMVANFELLYSDIIDQEIDYNAGYQIHDYNYYTYLNKYELKEETVIEKFDYLLKTKEIENSFVVYEKELDFTNSSNNSNDFSYTKETYNIDDVSYIKTETKYYEDSSKLSYKENVDGQSLINSFSIYLNEELISNIKTNSHTEAYVIEASKTALTLRYKTKLGYLLSTDEINDIPSDYLSTLNKYVSYQVTIDSIDYKVKSIEESFAPYLEAKMYDNTAIKKASVKGSNRIEFTYGEKVTVKTLSDSQINQYN